MLYGSVPAYVIPEGYMHHSNLYKIYACMFNSRRICAQVLYSDFLTIFLWKIYWDAKGLTGEYNSMEKCFGDDSNLPWSLNDVWPTEEGVVYWGLLMVCCSLGTSFHWGMIIFFFLTNHWGLKLTPPSRGFYQTLLGKFILQLSRGLLLCLGLMGCPFMISSLLGI